MEIQLRLTDPGALKPKPKDESALGFGDIFTDHMFRMDFVEGKGWVNPRIEPYGPISLDPAAMSIHYGQQVFEGLKAYRSKKGEILLFRPTENLKRMNNSARRLCMPELDMDFAFYALKKLISIERDWVPRSKGTSLYIRPTMLATEPHLGVRPAREYLFYIILGPVGAYYKEGFNPVKIYVEDRFVRAAKGGTGEAKAAGNYAASLLAAEMAKKKGFTQVLWLDAVHKKYVEEVGTMNMFFGFEEEVATAPLDGSILPGVTRDSVIRILKEWGININERPITIDEVVEKARNGQIKEAFGTGTAAVISPVGQITYKDMDLLINNGKTGELSLNLYNELTAIQYGEKEDPYGWVVKVE